MTVDEAETWIDLARRKGVVEVHVGDFKAFLGPLTAAPSQPQTKADQGDETIHPLDAIQNPPKLGGPFDAEEAA